jgi:hypothetical protein
MIIVNIKKGIDTKALAMDITGDCGECNRHSSYRFLLCQQHWEHPFLSLTSQYTEIS